MSTLICASTGKSITLISELTASGEGTIWRTDSNGYLAKIYKDPTLKRVQKLAVMISHSPKDPNSHLHHISFAWPKSVLKNYQGDCVGFLMPEIKNSKELIDVYNPQRYKKLNLKVDWRFLHITAQNIASIITALHTHGYVLGDIKPQNILVNNRALPSIIDTDSFQVRNPKNGEIYRCPVGSPDYTPAELIGKDFSDIYQTEVHDRFRLAVIIYQLLFGGERPFAGKWIGAGETPENNELIRRGLWLYSPNTLFQAVERTIPLEIVHPEIQRCFLRCFNDGHQNPRLRPSAQEWLEALKVASNELSLCGRVDSHYYSQTYGKCYWCDRSTKSGVDIFPGVVRVQPRPIIRRTNVDRLELRHTLTGHSWFVTFVAFSPDGQTLASASADRTIKLWDLNTGNLRHTLTGHSWSVIYVAFSPDGQTVASGSGDKTIKLWDVKTGNLRRSLTGHSDWVNSVAFSPDGKTLASGSGDKTIKLWDVKTGNLHRTLTGHSKLVRSVAFSPDGQTVASGSSDKTIKLWDLNTGNLFRTLTWDSHWVFSVAFSPDFQTVATGSLYKTIKLWDLNTGTLRRKLTRHSYCVTSVSFSPDGQTLASVSYDKTIKLWDLNTGTLRRKLTGHSEAVMSVAFSPDGQTLASGSFDNTIKIWQFSSPITQVSQYNQSSSPSNQVSPAVTVSTQYIQQTNFQPAVNNENTTLSNSVATEDELIGNIAKLVIVVIGLFFGLFQGWLAIFVWYIWFSLIWLCFCLMRSYYQRKS
ncbi:MAG: hypothetical protein MET45_00890 [Nostoc sp. LLA-1]|nr:hypothetical protein [Cyanocohniella sp. LLY]